MGSQPEGTDQGVVHALLTLPTPDHLPLSTRKLRRIIARNLTGAGNELEKRIRKEPHRCRVNSREMSWKKGLERWRIMPSCPPTMLTAYLLT